jgi:hypothetical protein
MHHAIRPGPRLTYPRSLVALASRNLVDLHFICSPGSCPSVSNFGFKGGMEIQFSAVQIFHSVICDPWLWSSRPRYFLSPSATPQVGLSQKKSR